MRASQQIGPFIALTVLVTQARKHVPMPVEPRATLQVFTLREGLLARLGHDLRLSFARFDIACDRGNVDVRVDLGSLQVDGAIRDAVLDDAALSAADRSKILESAREEVLQVGRYPEARYTGAAHPTAPGHFAIEGTLALRDIRAPLSVSVVLRGRELVAECTLRPSLFGIKPFRALGGAIRIRDHARIVANVPLPEALSEDSLLALPIRFGAA